jgi:hypothetical protein
MTGAAVADDLTLSGGEARLTGIVRSINEAGVVELSSELSPDPLWLRSGVVEKIEFSTHRAVEEPVSTIIGLTNGDLLPVRIERLDDRHFHVVSPEVGRMEIRRDIVKSIQTGVRRRIVVYEGPNSTEEWKSAEDGRNNLTFENDVLLTNGPTAFSKKLALPRQFILRFTLSWLARQSPNFQVYFADPLLAKGEPCDRYYLQFGGAGLEIKREASRGKRYNTIAILNRTPDQMPDNRIQVELRVNRDTARMELFINGEPEGEFADPIARIPDASGIAFVSNTPNGMTQRISSIEILEFDDSSTRHRAEDRGDPLKDSLISREDDRWSGRLMAIRPTPEGLVFSFKTDFQREALQIPESDISTVFLAGANPASPEDPGHPFVIRLAGEGELRVASCVFGGEHVTATHPLLGQLAIRRDGIVSLERTSPTPEPKAGP